MFSRCIDGSVVNVLHDLLMVQTLIIHDVLMVDTYQKSGVQTLENPSRNRGDYDQVWKPGSG